MGRTQSMHARLAAVLAAVVLLNVLAVGGDRWFGGLTIAGLGVGLMAYLLGVRHAFDADHIAAIDNLTRRLRAQGQRPVGVGLFFSLGHSTVVVLLTAVVIFAAQRAGSLVSGLPTWGARFGGLLSAASLTCVGLANVRLLTARGPQAQRSHTHRGSDGSPDGHVIEPFSRDRSWKCFPLGMLFGLSFDTASEVALLAMSLAAAHEGNMPPWGALCLPMLFAAGMATMDTLESLAMLRLYDWAIADQNRTLRLNSLITGLSVCLALSVAGYQWIQFLGGQGFAVPKLPILDSSRVGLLATAALLGCGAFAWAWRRRLDLRMAVRAP